MKSMDESLARREEAIKRRELLQDDKEATFKVGEKRSSVVQAENGGDCTGNPTEDRQKDPKCPRTESAALGADVPMQSQSDAYQEKVARVAAFNESVRQFARETCDKCVVELQRENLQLTRELTQKFNDEIKAYADRRKQILNVPTPSHQTLNSKSCL